MTLILPTYKRRELLWRFLRSLKDQTYTNVEVFLVGDGCLEFEAMVEEEEFKSYIAETEALGFRWVIDHFAHEGHPYHIVNHAIQGARGKYLIWAGDDDWISPSHIQTYLNGIQGTGYKLVMYDAWHDLPDRSKILETEFTFGKTGHAAIIVETETARTCSPHVKSYGEDWIFLEEMMQYPHVKSDAYPTYHVNGDPTHPSLTYGRPRSKRRKKRRQV